VPSLINGESQGESLEPSRSGSNLGEWVTGLLSRFPASYREVDEYLRSIMPDLSDIQNEPIGRNAKSLVIRFATDGKATLAIDFSDLSDGEKCFFLIATVLAANKYSGMSPIITCISQRFSIISQLSVELLENPVSSLLPLTTSM
jgi:hypothetical protein